MSGDQLMNVKSDDLEAIWLVVDGLGQVRARVAKPKKLSRA